MPDLGLGVPALGACVITVSAVLALRPLAFAVDLLDRPGGRKTHHGVVPLVGGLAMLLGVVFGLVSAPTALGNLQPYLVSGVLLAIVGMLDDRFNLSPRIRLVAQFSAVLPMFFGAGVRLTSFGDLIGIGPLDVTGFSLITTAFVTIAAINCFNMLDGMDGLAGGIALVSAALMFLLPSGGGLTSVRLLASVLCGAITGFLIFNLPVNWNRKLRCFMGDAGSTLLGFSMAWLMIGSSQGPARLAAPVTMVWLVAVPATDLVWAVIRRLSRGQSPLHADDEHLHHMLLRAGMGVRAVFIAMIGLSLLGGLVGLQLDRANVPEWVSFWLLVVTGCILVIVSRQTALLAQLVPARFARPSRTV